MASLEFHRNFRIFKETNVRQSQMYQVFFSQG